MESPFSSSKGSNLQNPNPNSLSPSPSASPVRQWRPAAQKNVRNQWSKILSSKNRWFSACSDARSHATSLVNAHLSRRYLPHMDLGALKDMPSIRQKASEKLERQQEVFCSNLLSSYKDMVAAVALIVQSSSLMRCYQKVSGVSSIVQFTDHFEDVNDLGDGGGIPVFSFFSISNFENMALELAEMFILELSLKRMIVVELLSFDHKEGSGQTGMLSWFHELYHGEFNDLKMSNMLSNENSKPLAPRIKDWQAVEFVTNHSKHARSSETLQVYLTTWLADVNIDMNRMREIFSMVEDEMQVKLS